MKWKASEPIAPKHADSRTKTRFAYWFKRIGGAWYLWCQYEELQVFEVREVVAMIDKGTYKFEVGKWVTVQTKATKWIPA